MNNIENEKKRKKEGRVITFLIVGILTLISAISGATYAYFQATANKAFGNSANSESGYVSGTDKMIKLTVTSVAPTDSTKKLIPISNTAIQTAVTASCLDTRGNAVCKQYTILVENKSNVNYWLDGTLQLSDGSSNTMPNLKWALGTSATAGFPAASTATIYTESNTSLGANFKLNAAGSKYFYVVIWISETGAAQTDSGTFTGTVTFTAYSDSGDAITGVTSTIRS